METLKQKLFLYPTFRSKGQQPAGYRL